MSVTHGEDRHIIKLSEIMRSGVTFVTFNGNSFDIPIITAALAGATQEDLKKLANMIIDQEMRPWQVYRKFRLTELNIDHIDLIEVAPGSFSSLKAYGARMNMPIIRDLPYHHDAVLTDDEKVEVSDYCDNDVDTTEALFNTLRKEIDLRIVIGKEYKEDFRSKSDSQMAETVFAKTLNIARRDNLVPYTVKYKAPSFITFERPDLQALLEKIQETEYAMNGKTGHVILPEFLGKDKVTIGNGVYQTGVGGLHSTHDKHVCHIASKDYIITDIDAASFYPNIAVICGMIPQNTGAKFIELYRDMIARRLEAKRLWKNAEKAGDIETAEANKAIADTLRISLNGTFGKTASRWSPLYSPDLMIAITLTGQLVLLSMIEQIEKLGATVLSANTDGIAIGAPRDIMSKVGDYVDEFSALSGFEFEYTPYRVLAIKDVNNYLAVTTRKKIKAKGLYAKPDLRKNPTAPICSRAVQEWLLNGTDFRETIRFGQFTEFLSARSVTGGGVQGDKYLGRVVRWYNSTDTSLPNITYAKNGNKVPKTDGVREAMVIPQDLRLPKDLDFTWYRKEAIRIAQDIGASEFLTAEEIELVAPPPKVKKVRKVKS